ncbi:MAG: hypothetical protein HOP25_08775 [Methylotenera sp.]|nr:hypothetical protein [Methylotenera sp.]
MDGKTFALLSKFTIAARKVAGSINPSKLITDKHYANEVFWKVNHLGDEALIMMSLDLQNQLGMLTPVVDKTPTAIPAVSIETDKKYLFGARG